MDQLRSGLVSVYTAFLDSESLAAECLIAMNAQCDDLLPEFPLRYHVAIQHSLTTSVAVAAMASVVPTEMNYQRAA